MLNFTVENTLNEENEPKLQLQMFKSNNKIAIAEYLKLLPYVLPKHESVSKIAISRKQILK